MKHQLRNLLVIRNYTEGKAAQQEANATADDLKKTVPTVVGLFSAWDRGRRSCGEDPSQTGNLEGT
jgi:hypothetical protein